MAIVIVGAAAFICGCFFGIILAALMVAASKEDRD